MRCSCQGPLLNYPILLRLVLLKQLLSTCTFNRLSSWLRLLRLRTFEHNPRSKQSTSIFIYHPGQGWRLRQRTCGEFPQHQIEQSCCSVVYQLVYELCKTHGMDIPHLPVPANSRESVTVLQNTTTPRNQRTVKRHHSYQTSSRLPHLDNVKALIIHPASGIVMYAKNQSNHSGISNCICLSVTR